MEDISIQTVLESNHSLEEIDTGDILEGSDYFTKVPDEYYGQKMFFPLWGATSNTWESLDIMHIECAEFKEKVKANCPYTGWDYFRAVPIFLFTENVTFWMDRFKCFHRKMYEDREWQLEMNSPKKKENGFSLSKVQKFLLGSGYTCGTMVQDGDVSLKDALVYLSNGDSIGFKIWMWYNK